jgi:hypothetical protein
MTANDVRDADYATAKRQAIHCAERQGYQRRRWPAPRPISPRAAIAYFGANLLVIALVLVAVSHGWLT